MKFVAKLGDRSDFSNLHICAPTGWVDRFLRNNIFGVSCRISANKMQSLKLHNNETWSINKKQQVNDYNV